MEKEKASAQKPRLHERVEKHSLFNLAVKLVALAVGITTMVGLLLHFNHGSETTTTGGTSPPRSSLSSVGPASTRSTSNPGILPKVGSCLDANASLSACDASHRLEVYSLSLPCNEDSLLQYLGGNPGEDVLSTNLIKSISRIGGQQICVVQRPEGPTNGNAHLILDGPAGDTWRRCLDTRFGHREVSCAAPHTDEFVFLGSPPLGQAVDCTQKAVEYMAVSETADLSAVTIRSATEGKQSACLVEVLGNNLLTASVRRLGTNAFPIMSG